MEEARSKKTKRVNWNGRSWKEMDGICFLPSAELLVQMISPTTACDVQHRAQRIFGCPEESHGTKTFNWSNGG